MLYAVDPDTDSQCNGQSIDEKLYLEHESQDPTQRVINIFSYF